MTSQPEKWTNRALIAWTKSFFEKKGIENPKLEAEVLLSHATGTSRIELFMNYDDEPSEENRAAFRELVRRRALGEPVAYLVGVKEFYSLPFLVDSNTLIPRPETEQLVLETIEYFKKQGWRTGSDGVRKRGVETEEDAPDHRETEERELKICDVGVGSGCVSVALVKNIPAARVVALDVSPATLEVARKNVEKLGVVDRVELRQSDLLDAIPSDLPEEARFDAIVSNPPYVSESEYVALEATVREYEPKIALVGGATGAELALRLVRQAPDRLKLGGRLALELSPTTVEIVARELEKDARWNSVEIRRDFAGLPRFVVAFRQK